MTRIPIGERIRRLIWLYAVNFSILLGEEWNLAWTDAWNGRPRCRPRAPGLRPPVRR